MKKFYLFVVAAVVALCASASVNQIPLQKAGEKAANVKMPTQKGTLTKGDGVKRAGAAKDGESPKVITDADIPSDCQIETYYRNSSVVYYSWGGNGSSNTDGKFKVAFGTDGKVYIQNPAWFYDSYNAWVEGTYDWMTGIIVIPTGQYLSWSDEYGYGIQLVWGWTNNEISVGEEPDQIEYNFISGVDETVTSINFLVDGNKLYLLNSYGDVSADYPNNYVSEGMYCMWSDDHSFTCNEFASVDENGNDLPFGEIIIRQPAVPADPTADDWYDCGDESGFSKFYFTLPTTDVDGNTIDADGLSYSIFIDNGNGPELFTFSGEDYAFDLNPEDSYTEIPYWLYSSAVDFKEYYCYFYRTNAEGYEPLFTKNIGIQVIYSVDGVRNASNIAWLYSTVSISVSAAGVATFCGDKALDFTESPEGFKAYIITGVEENGYTLTAQQVTGVVPAGTGLFIEAPEGSYTFTPVESDSYTDVSANKLIGVTEDTTAPVGSYVLQKQDRVGFYQVEEGTEITIPAGRAYLPASIAASDVKGLAISFDDDVTGIANVNVDLNAYKPTIVNLAGQRLQKMQKGINIVGGKKVLY